MKPLFGAASKMLGPRMPLLRLLIPHGIGCKEITAATEYASLPEELSCLRGTV
jgi:hypothetical protein